MLDLNTRERVNRARYVDKTDGETTSPQINQRLRSVKATDSIHYTHTDYWKGFHCVIKDMQGYLLMYCRYRYAHHSKLLG